HANQRRLAGSVRAQQPEDLAGFNVKADAVDGGEVAELLDDLVNLNRVRHRTGSRTYAVMPTARARAPLSTRRGVSKVLMSRLVRLTSRWVANPASTPRKKILPCRSAPEGSRTLRLSPSRTRSM